MDGSQPPRFDPLWADKKQKASAAPPQAANGVPPMPANGVPPMLLGESSGRLQLPPEMVRPGEAPPMVIQMDPKAYGAAVAGHVATLVLFTVSWCAPCKLFQPSFEAAVPAVQAVNMDVVMGTVDCEAYPQFRAWEQLKQFPTVRFYRQGVSEPQQYDGEWTEAGVVRWVQAQFGVAPPAPPPPPAVSAAARAAYLRAMQTSAQPLWLEHHRQHHGTSTGSTHTHAHRTHTRRAGRAATPPPLTHSRVTASHPLSCVRAARRAVQWSSACDPRPSPRAWCRRRTR